MPTSRKKPRKSTRSTANPPPPRPWVIGGVDYGPAVAAVADLASWAFALASADVADWPEGQRRVGSARRYVLARMRGRQSHDVPTEDILFTAGLLARIFEADLDLGMAEMVGILDDLGLPTDAVPLMPRPQPAARIRIRSNVVPFPQRHRGDTAAPRCEACELEPRYRNAA